MNWHIEPASPLSLEKNIISKAVSLFRNRTGYDDGLKITVEKHIPLGGGLGGGSSNAATTLLALNRLAAPAAGTPPALPADLAEMGASLGSDVPFFLSIAAARASCAWVSGRGENVRPLELPESVRGLSLVLVNPGFPSDTAAAFRLFDTYHHASPPHNVEVLLQSFSGPPGNWSFFNDFLPVFLNKTGEFRTGGEVGTIYGRIISDLYERGADFAGLSGSGSTCFGVFAQEDTANLALASLKKRWSFVINTFFTCAYGNTILQ